MPHHFRTDPSDASQDVADAIGVQHELKAQSNTPFFFEMGRDGGRSIGSFQAPMVASSSADHSSAGSSTTVRPTRRTTTSVWPSGNRQDRGSRTAWLPPF